MADDESLAAIAERNIPDNARGFMKMPEASHFSSPTILYIIPPHGHTTTQKRTNGCVLV